MAAAASLQTATAAISVIQLAYQTYRLVTEIANAHIEAKLLHEKTTRLFGLVKSVQARLDIRKQIRGDLPVAPDEEDVEATIHSSLKACRQCFYRLNRKLRGLTSDQPLNFHHRVVEGLRFTLSHSERMKQERALETNIQSLTTSLHLLQLLEHDATGKRLNRLEKSMNQALMHLRFMSQSLSPATSPAVSPLMSNFNALQAELPVEDTDRLAIESLSRTIEVARSTASMHGSNFDPDRRSSVRITVEADTDESDNDEHIPLDVQAPMDMDLLPSYGDVLAADTPDPSQADSIGLGLAEPIDDPARGSWRPPEILFQYKRDYQEAAEKEFTKGNFATAEEYQKKAFDHGTQIEQQGHGRFEERKQMRYRLADLFVKQDKHGEAARELQNIFQELEVGDSHDQKKEQAELYMKLAKVHHAMFVAGKDGVNRDVAEKNIQTAEIYAFDRAFSRLYELREAGDIQSQDEIFQECASLVVQILEDQGKVVEAESWRHLYLGAGQSTTLLSPTASATTDQGQSDDEESAYDKQTRLLGTVGRPKISNAIIFNLPDRLQEILEEELAADNPQLDERCHDKQWTPLMYAVACDHKGSCACELAIDKLVHHGADLHATVGQGKDVETALHQAVAAGQDDKVHYLLRKGFDKNSCAPYTAVLTAVKKNQPQLVELLLEHGAEPPVDGNKWTLMHHAVASGSFDALTVLIRDEYRDKIALEARCSALKTPLLLCAEFPTHRMRYAMAEELLKLQADANAQDEKGRTPLYHATNRKFGPTQTSRDTFAKLLIDYGADWTRTPEKFRSSLIQYPSVREAMGKCGTKMTRKDSGVSNVSGGRRSSGSTFRSVEAASVRESTRSKLLSLPFGRNRAKSNG